MSWLWLALAQERPDGCLASAQLRDLDGAPAGVLASWEADASPPDGALRVDRRAVDPGGDEAWVSLVLARPGVSVHFDDPGVSGALRSVLAGTRADVVSTLLVEETHFGGALTAVRDAGWQRLRSDPFRRLFPGRLLRAGPGLLGRTPWPCGPGIARYRGWRPWPWDRFED